MVRRAHSSRRIEAEQGSPHADLEGTHPRGGGRHQERRQYARVGPKLEVSESIPDIRDHSFPNQHAGRARLLPHAVDTSGAGDQGRATRPDVSL